MRTLAHYLNLQDVLHHVREVADAQGIRIRMRIGERWDEDSMTSGTATRELQEDFAIAQTILAKSPLTTLDIQCDGAGRARMHLYPTRNQAAPHQRDWFDAQHSFAPRLRR